MNETQRLADSAARMLRWSEINEDWSLMEKLIGLLQEMGGKVIRIGDPRFTWRSDYVVSFTSNSAPSINTGGVS